MSKLAKALSAAAGNAGGDNLFVEDVFSTYLYAGTGSAETITTGIDMLGEGGLVWNKNRTQAIANLLVDSERGSVGKYLSSDSQAAEANITGNSFTNTGYVLGTDMGSISGNGYASWSWRKAKGWFDIQTWTGNSTAGRTIAHNLGSAPKFVLVKRTNTSNNWICWHSALTNTQYIQLNSTSQAFSDGGIFWNSTTPDASNLTLGNDSGVNGSGSTYVAYLFGDDAVFNEDGDEQICKIGSYTGTGSNENTITLGFEPQWLMWKPSSGTGDWQIVDSMRGWTADGVANRLEPNTTDAEALTGSSYCNLTSTGFVQNGSSGSNNASGTTYIYMAIRMPMKVPTAGTEVFDPDAYTATSNSETVTTGFPVDLFLGLQRNGTAYKNVVFDRLRTGTVGLNTASTDDDENYAQYAASLDNNTGFTDNNLTSGNQIISYAFKRAPKFFDMVAWTGSTSNSTAVNHNLTVIPELAIRKRRDANQNWYVWHKDWSSNGYDGNITLNSNSEGYNNDSAFYSALTATQITQGVNNTGTFICYLFATLAGISKVGSYSGTGSAINVDCGFSNGARFILIKRANGSGDWYVYDSARGIVAGNDPYLLLNSTAVEVTNTDYIDPLASGFTVTSSAPAGLNASGGTYLFLAIA